LEFGSKFVILLANNKRKVNNMIKKERSKKEKMIQNPFSFYVTNVGFIGNQPSPQNRSVNKKS